ncbi:fatty acid synthase alpha subunit Lsd1, partial [Spiromyces aspiralis]
IKTQKQKRGYDTRPAQVILPLSPNHGIFGSDGLYSESKISLETLFNRWHCESWGGYLTITGAVIGWTRGTGLMNVNNVIADKVEALGVRSFSSQEMAFNILGLMHPRVSHLAENEPVWADLNGGFQFLPNLNHLFKKYHLELQESKDIKRAIAADTALDHKVVGNDHSAMYKAPTVEPRANLKFEFPECKPYEALERLSQLRGMFNLDKVVVVTGFGEVGPWGNAGTRWEMESKGEFSLEGCIELAWIMGYI